MKATPRSKLERVCSSPSLDLEDYLKSSRTACSLGNTATKSYRPTDITIKYSKDSKKAWLPASSTKSMTMSIVSVVHRKQCKPEVTFANSKHSYRIKTYPDTAYMRLLMATGF